MINISFVFQGNMKFAWLPDEREIVENGYIPLLKILEEHSGVRSDFAFSGYSSLALKEQYPDAAEMIKKGIKEKRLSISTNGYEHIAYPFVSSECAEKNITKGLTADKSVWGVSDAEGFFPSDCAWDPLSGLQLTNAGVKWIICPAGLMNNAIPCGGKSSLSEYNPYLPINALCPDGARIPFFFYQNNNYHIFEKSEDMEKWFLELEGLIKNSKDDLVVPIGLDMETILVLEKRGHITDGSECFKRFLGRLEEIQGVQFSFLGDFLRAHPPEDDIFVKHSYWMYGNGCWLPDGSQKLISVSDSAEKMILECEALIDSGLDCSGLKDEIETAWEFLLASHVTDAKFTDRWDYPFPYPAPKVILKAYDNALAAEDLARKIKKNLLQKIIKA
jgi:hypothetical protein